MRRYVATYFPKQGRACLGFYDGLMNPYVVRGGNEAPCVWVSGRTLNEGPPMRKPQYLRNPERTRSPPDVPSPFPKTRMQPVGMVIIGGRAPVWRETGIPRYTGITEPVYPGVEGGLWQFSRRKRWAHRERWLERGKYTCG